MPQTASFKILAHEPGTWLVASWHNISFVYWQEQGTLQAVSRIRDTLEHAYSSAQFELLSTVHLIRDGAGLPDADVRTAVLDMSAHFAPRTACLAIVLMGSGFWASAMQSLLTALRVIAPRRSGVMRFFRDPVDLCRWFPSEHTARTGIYVDEELLARVMDRVFAEG